MDTIKVVLAGQPNVGKSMLINTMSGSNALKVGNFSGVTVEKTEVSFHHDSHTLEMVDLPGTYSISGFTQEEKVAHTYLLNEEYDVIINVLDSTHLQRNLLLTLELLKLNKKMVLALNMADEAQKEHLEIDIAKIEAITGVPTILVSANSGEGIEELLHRVHEVYDSKNRSVSNIVYSEPLEEEILELSNFMDEKGFQLRDLTSREMAIRILFEDKDLYEELHVQPIIAELQPRIVAALEHIYKHHETKNVSDIKANEYIAIARGIRMETVKCKKIKKSKNSTQKIDDILLNKFIGIPIFLFFMWGLFQLTFEIGSIPMDWIEAGMGAFGDWIGSLIPHEATRSLIVDGIIAGVGAVLLFLPNIIILYIGIALLETTGYMSRVAFLLDGFFHKFGLHGKSFIPLVTGFGCSVPAYMSTRTLKNEKDRLITLFIIGFMSCGAKMPVYVLFVGVFFAPEEAGNILFIIYLAGAFLGLIMAKALRLFVFKGEAEPFVMEMPKYRLPSFSLIWHTVYNKALSYLKKAGTFILAASMLIWFASTYPKQPLFDTEYASKIEQAGEDKLLVSSLENELKLKKLENSYLGQIGKATELVFAPLGFDWKMTVALETGLAAKEVVVSTLGVLYAIGDEVDAENSTLQEKLRENISFASAMAFIVFVMIYLPCLAASMVFAKEAGGYKYLVYLFVFTSVTAWVLSFITYRILV
ncbi:MAG: Ferrous iron transport protein B [uncultured Sulfurovum sp.]|uniref:Ferrous iron transport protein B n=1 Tax=uncultured Sulfurovum sp. TaxID=269237 RepID=A0A6S6SBS5_9BACT|nr:MAG: Ferrous iron transport protein B [uncultured Sulfurovum sp.]